MHVLITGGAGFLGRVLAPALLVDENITVTLTDIIDPPIPQGIAGPDRIRTIKEARLLENCDKVLDVPGADGTAKSLPDVIYILHGVMSSKSEQDFELGMHANLDVTRALLEAIRKRSLALQRQQSHRVLPRVIFTSSLAVYGPPSAPTDKVSETTVVAPQSSYGTAKAMCEALIADYSRRGWIQGLILRLPTISVRPGAPAAAASAFLSAIVREPLNGNPSILPIRDDNLEVWLSSPRMVVHNLVHAATLSIGTILTGQHLQQMTLRPTVNLPGISVTVANMLAAVEKVGGQQASKLILRKPDSEVERIVASWPANFDVSLGEKLGFGADTSFEEIVMEYMTQYMD